MIILCDLDGTVADNSHRQGFIQSTKKDWDSFYRPELILQDKPIEKAKAWVPNLISRVGPENFIFLTGRPERTRQATEQWLSQNIGIAVRRLGYATLAPYSNKHLPQLVMRKDGDHRAAHVYKEELCEFLRTNSTTLLFLDDDERNTMMYSRYGIFLKAPECWEVFR